jgi:hypothetical protein
MLIGFMGGLQSGKDTSFTLTKEIFPRAERIAFADIVKKSASAALGISLDTFEYLKTHPTARYSVDGVDGEVVSDFHIREFIQRYGTEAHRDIFGEDFWVDLVLPKHFNHENRLVIITDVRFENEIDRVKLLGGIIINVIRKKNSPFLGHVSEHDLSHRSDYNVANDSDLDLLSHNLMGVFKKIGLLEKDF